MKGTSGSPLLDAVVPVLAKEMTAEYDHLVGILRKLITSKTENAQFFRAPVTYLKAQKALTFDTVELPNGQTVPTVQDKPLAEAIRKARDLYADGKLSVDNIEVSLLYRNLLPDLIVRVDRLRNIIPSRLKTVIPDRLRIRTRTRFLPRQIIIRPYILTKPYVYCKLDNRLVIDERNMGPLVDPKVLDRVKAASKIRVVKPVRKASPRKRPR